jgi:amino acid efflux transporter
MADGTRPQLVRSLTDLQALALAVSLVLGSGLMVLPGLAYRASGRASLYAWVLDAVVVVPLLAMYARMGARYSTADGVAGFASAAFGSRARAATEVLMIGTVVLGVPGIAVTGGRYVADVTGGGGTVVTVAALALIALALAVNLAGAGLSGVVQQLVTVVLLVVLGGLAVAGALAARPAGSDPVLAPLADLPAATSSLGMLFVAFTGWEMLSFTAEEYRSPRRIPLIVASSFGLVTMLYLGLAWAVQRVLDPADPRLGSAPLVGLAAEAVGSTGAAVVAAVAVLVLAANLLGSVWASSRLVFAASRHGHLPAALCTLRGRRHVPRQAVLVVAATFAAVVLAVSAGWIPFPVLFALSGQNYFILYGIGVVCFLRLERGRCARLLGVAGVVIVAAVSATFGFGLLYPAALTALGAAIIAVRRPRWAGVSATGKPQSPPRKFE